MSRYRPVTSSITRESVFQNAFIEVNEKGSEVPDDTGEIFNNYITKFKYNIYFQYNRIPIIILYLYLSITNIKNLWF